MIFFSKFSVNFYESKISKNFYLGKEIFIIFAQ